MRNNEVKQNTFVLLFDNCAEVFFRVYLCNLFLCSEARETFENSAHPLDFKQCKHKYQEIIIFWKKFLGNIYSLLPMSNLHFWT